MSKMVLTSSSTSGSRATASSPVRYAARASAWPAVGLESSTSPASSMSFGHVRRRSPGGSRARAGSSRRRRCRTWWPRGCASRSPGSAACRACRRGRRTRRRRTARPRARHAPMASAPHRPVTLELSGLHESARRDGDDEVEQPVDERDVDEEAPPEHEREQTQHHERLGAHDVDREDAVGDRRARDSRAAGTGTRSQAARWRWPRGTSSRASPSRRRSGRRAARSRRSRCRRRTTRSDSG